MIIIVAENGRRTGKTLSLAVVSTLVGGSSKPRELAQEVSGTIGVLRRKKKEEGETLDTATAADFVSPRLERLVRPCIR